VSVADRKPPRRVGASERETLLTLLQFQRESFVRKVESVDDRAARESPVASGTTLLWLTRHLAMAETLWIVHRFAGEDASAVPPDAVQPDDTIGGAVDAYRATWVVVDGIVAAASLEDVCAQVGAETPVDLRWVLMHLLEETARHAGHADILRELVDGTTGR
jgi:uncharacterized damage-inducible protein DinB